MDDEYVVKIIHETEGAYLVTDDESREVWIPKSQVEHRGETDGYVTFYIPEWLAKDKEFI